MISKYLDPWGKLLPKHEAKRSTESPDSGFISGFGVLDPKP